MPTEPQLAANDAALKTQLAAVQHQADSDNALELAIRVKAGWVVINGIGGWSGKEPGPVSFRMNSTGKIITSGYEHARRAVMSGVATLV